MESHEGILEHLPVTPEERDRLADAMRRVADALEKVDPHYFRTCLGKASTRQYARRILGELEDEPAEVSPELDRLANRLAGPLLVEALRG